MTKNARIAAALSFALFAIALAYSRPVAGLPSLPAIDGWLFHEKTGYADWLGLRFFGRNLREPINVIIVDPFSKTEQDAIRKVIRECAKAGYPEEFGHSAGYFGIIDGLPYQQINGKRREAFSNHDFFLMNNHGRIIGPALKDGAFVFIAAFSTEKPTIFRGFHHLFVSFNLARDDFCAKLDAKSAFKKAGRLYLGNVLQDGAETTADHDGYATVLVARE